jgi:serine/threonine-protein kinase RsbW
MSLLVPNSKEQWPLLRRTLHEYGMCIGIEKSTLKKLEVAFEEAVINIMSYSHATVIDLQIMNYELQDTNYKLQITLTDDGVPFDPTVRESDTSKAIEERQIGGLGISLMRQIMDELHYQRTDGKNQLIITKNIQL